MLGRDAGAATGGGRAAELGGTRRSAPLGASTRGSSSLRSAGAEGVRVTTHEYQKLNGNFSALGSVVENLRSRLAILEDEIKADEGGIADYEVILRRIKIEREMLTVRLEHNRAWAHKFDADVGPFEKQYDRLTEEIGTLYDDAKTKHARGLQVLMDEFHYHPAFRRAKDNFTAVPFRPK